MDNILKILNQFILTNCEFCEHENCLISSLRGLRNGFYYGGKVRFIHSLVIEILFGKSKSITDKIKAILSPTFEHAKNLGLFVLIYKTTVCLLRRVLKTQSKLINFFAGLVGAYFVWSKKSSVNMQIMLYLLSRNILAVSNIISEKYIPNFQGGFSITSLLVWGVVMYLFEFKPLSLQGSLKSSMDFIYKDSDSYISWRDFIPFYIPSSIENLFN